MTHFKKKLQIGNINIDFPFFLAPMAGVTDYAFRVIAKEFGAGIVYSEFVSAHGIIRKNEKTLKMIQFSKKGAGSAALKDLCLMEDITQAVVESVPKIPVTVKMRSGWNAEKIVSTEAGIKLEKIGVKAITLHPRTTVQMYKSKANWDLIKELKENVDIPVIGNGDVSSIDDIKKMFKTTNCDGIMIGRAALGNPWFFTEIKKYMNNEDPKDISMKERFEVCQKHLDLLVQTHGEVIGTNNMRKHFGWYFKGFKDASALRKKLVLVKNYSEMKDILSNIRH